MKKNQNPKYKSRYRLLFGFVLVVLVLLVASVKIFYLGFVRGEIIAPNGNYIITVAYIPSLLDLQIHPPGDGADFYVWVRLFTNDGQKLQEKLMTRNNINDIDKLWAGNVVILDSDTVWHLQEKAN